jgi:hypothetical protein
MTMQNSKTQTEYRLKINLIFQQKFLNTGFGKFSRIWSVSRRGRWTETKRESDVFMKWERQYQKTISFLFWLMHLARDKDSNCQLCAEIGIYKFSSSDILFMHLGLNRQIFFIVNTIIKYMKLIRWPEI